MKDSITSTVSRCAFRRWMLSSRLAPIAALSPVAWAEFRWGDTPMLADDAAQIAASQVWISLADGQYAGFISFYPKGMSMLPENIAVLPDTVEPGIGKALTGFYEAVARRHGLRSVSLWPTRTWPKTSRSVQSSTMS